MQVQANLTDFFSRNVTRKNPSQVILDFQSPAAIRQDIFSSSEDNNQSVIVINNNNNQHIISEGYDSPNEEEQEIAIPTEPGTAFSNWTWYKEGGLKRLKDGTLRQRYKCKSKDHTQCVAKLTEDLTTAGLRRLTVQGMHNHMYQQSQRITVPIRNKIVELYRGGSKVGQIHRAMVNDSIDPSDPQTTPTKKQVKNVVCYQNKKKIEEVYSQFIITERFEDNNHTIVVIPKEALVYLKTSRKYTMYIDGTFSMVEDKLTLTTILYEIEGIPVPVAWIIHSGKSEDDYFLALQDLKRKTDYLMEPAAIFLDYETALKKALTRTFSGVPLYGDYFHFMQANLRWLQNHQYSEHIPAATQSLQILWHSPTHMEFNSNLSLFKSIWEGTCFPYSHYFNEQWVKTITPVLWASYGRAQNVPSGDNAIESWHNRLKQLCNAKALSIGKLLVWLQEEWEYWSRILVNSHLKQDKLNQIKASRRYYKKKSLENFDPKSVQIEEVFDMEPLPAAESIPALPAPPVSAPPSPQGSQGSTVSVSAVPVAVSTPVQSPTATDALKCSSCHKLANKGCSNKMCRLCCSKIVTRCSISTHRYAKMQENDTLKKFREMINEAMSTKRILWVRYSSGRKAGQVRALRVKKWEDDISLKFLVDDMIEQDGQEHWEIDKTYKLTRIIEINWNVFE